MMTNTCTNKQNIKLFESPDSFDIFDYMETVNLTFTSEDKKFLRSIGIEG